MSTATVEDTTTDDRLRVASAVRAHYGAAGLSGAALARGIGMTQSKLSRRTTGTEPFDIDELSAIAHYLGVDIADLITGSNLPTRPRATGPAAGRRTLYLLGDSTAVNDGEITAVEPLAPVIDLFARQAVTA